MAVQNVHSREMSLVLSSDAKPRLKWTPELHQRFADAVYQLGGPEKATPKSLMRVMGVHGLTLYHLKSHLQKYRLGRSQQSQTLQQNTHEFEESQRSQLVSENMDSAHEQINRSVQLAQALQMQMEVQRKLHEQIEVQRHLQLRIEAQGKYLQSVLKKAQETISGYSSCSIEVENARAELSRLVSMVDSACPSTSFSVLTESGGSILRDASNKLLGSKNSLDSSLTSSESSGRKEKTERKFPVNNKTNEKKRNSVELSLMEMHPPENSGAENQNKKRSVNEINLTESSCGQGNSFGLLENIDLNCKILNDFDSGSNEIDLNRRGVEF